MRPTNAERFVLSRNPDMPKLRELQRHEPPAAAAPLTIPSRRLLGCIVEPEDSIAECEGDSVA